MFLSHFLLHSLERPDIKWNFNGCFIIAFIMLTYTMNAYNIILLLYSAFTIYIVVGSDSYQC